MDTFGTAVILAGGKSTRMGRDKQHLKFNDDYLIDLIACRLRPLFRRLIVVTNESSMSRCTDLEFMGDQVKGFGPLSGIYTGLRAADSRYVYVIACDMPVISPEFIDYMKERLMATGAQACVGLVPKGIEPFNAFYDKALLFPLSRYFKEGNLKISAFLDRVNVAYLDIEKIKHIDTTNIYLNLNTREDMERFEALRGYNL